MENQKKEREITFGYLMNVFKKSFVFMLLAAILFGAIGVAYSKFIDKPKYQATASFVVTNNSPEDYTTSGLTMASTAIAATCVEIANQQVPITMAIQDHNLCEALGYSNESECVKAIQNMITAKKSADENVFAFYIVVKTASRENTFAVTRAIEQTFPEAVKIILGNKESSLIAATSALETAADVKTVKTSPIKIGFLLAVVAAIITYCVFFVKTLLDKSIRNEDSVKENFKHPIVGVIPSFATPEEQAELKKYHKSKNSHAVAPRHYENKLLSEKSPFHITESFNTLRTNVIFSAAAAKNPIFAVTSDVAAAGKTVAAANLAISLSNLGKKVLLVECDMRCPSFNKLFGKKAESGLSELLAGIEEKTSDVAVNYTGTTLDILHCGKIPPNPSELLSSYRMAELTEEWRNEYDYIVLDMPPIGEVYDAGVVSNIVNGYIITVRANHSNITNVKTAVDRIESVKGSVLGLILNDVSVKSGRNYKTYYNHYISNK